MNHLYRLKLNLDRSLSSARMRQVLWILGVLLALFVGFYAVNCMLPKERQIKKASRILELLIDPGTFAAVPDEEVQEDVAEPTVVSATAPVDHRPRFFEFLITMSGAVLFTGLMISIISNMLEGRVEAFKAGRLRYNFKGHILVLGANDMLGNMIRAFAHNPKMMHQDIVVLTDTNIEELSARLFSELNRAELKNVTLLFGRRNSEEELKSVRLLQAERIYIVGENEEVEHDSMNIACLQKIEYLSNRRVEPLKCFMVIDKLTSYHVFQFRTDKDEEKIARKVWTKALMKKGVAEENMKAAMPADLLASPIQLTVVNALENWAQQVLVNGRFGHISYPFIDRTGIHQDSTERVHFVVVGMTQMALTMAATVAHIAHYPNFKEGISNTKTKISFIVPNIRQEMDFFMGHYRSLFDLCRATYIPCDGEKAEAPCLLDNKMEEYGDFLDIEWEFVDGGIETQAVRELLERWCDEAEETIQDAENRQVTVKHEILTIAVCGKNPTANVATSLYMPKKVYEKNVPVFVYQPLKGDILETANLTEHYKNIYPFGMRNDCYDPSLQKRIQKAKRINYVYENSGVYAYMTKNTETLDHLWYGLTFAHKLSNLYATNSIGSKLRSLGVAEEFKPSQMFAREFTTAEVETMARMEHNRWNVEKLLVGYEALSMEERNYLDSLEKTARKKARNEKKEHFKHPDIRPFDKLSKSSSDYDRSIVKHLFDVIKEN